MKTAYRTDLKSNKKGQPALEKLKLMPQVLKKLKNPKLAQIFLDSNGLNVLGEFLTKLPDGSLPLSSIRGQILELIFKMPISVDHLRYTNLGGTLNTLVTSSREFAGNKKLIQRIKDKWSRIICNINVEYTKLEQYERENGVDGIDYLKQVENEQVSIKVLTFSDPREKR